MRKLKADKASKDEIGAAVELLKSLKSEYKKGTGLDYDPNSKPASKPAAAPAASGLVTAWEKVQTQGDKVRKI